MYSSVALTSFAMLNTIANIYFQNFFIIPNRNSILIKL